MNIAIQESTQIIEMPTVVAENTTAIQPKKVEKLKKQLKYLTTTGFRNRKSWHIAKPKMRAQRYACGSCQLAYIGKANERCQCKPMKHRSA